jgi:hypothetical protein
MDDTAGTAEDSPVIIDVLANDTDTEGDGLSVSHVTQGQNGSVVNNGSDVTYTPDPDFNGSDSFTYIVSDGTSYSDPATVTVTVTASNDPPTADNKSVTTAEGTQTGIVLTGSDPDGDFLSFRVVSDPADGTLSGAAPNLTYSPNGGFTGEDSFTYVANDGMFDSLAATVSITVTGANDPPTADDKLITTSEDSSVEITLTGSDPDGDPLTFSVVSGPDNGTLNGSAPNHTYIPAADFNGSDSFTYISNDGKADSSPATVSITVTGVNDMPVAHNKSVTTDQDTSVNFTVTASDPDGDPLTFALVNPPTNGELSGDETNLTYIPNGGFHGTDSFTFAVNDGTVDSLPATVTITVNATAKGFCGLAPMTSEGRRTKLLSLNACERALLPLLPSGIALGVWFVVRISGRGRQGE